MKLLSTRLIILAVMGAARLAWAQSTNTVILHPDLPGAGLSVIRTLAALAFVLALLFGGLWLFRNAQRLAWRKTGAPRLAILESRALGNRFALHVVGYEQQRLLIGSSPGGLSLLSQLPPASDVHAEAAQGAAPGSFSQRLLELLPQK